MSDFISKSWHLAPDAFGNLSPLSAGEWKLLPCYWAAIAFRASEKPAQWLLDLCCLVVWSTDPEGMCVRAAGVCVCSLQAAPLQGLLPASVPSQTACWGFPVGSVGKESTCNAGAPGSIPGLGRVPGKGNGNPLWYSGLENPMDRGPWRATVLGGLKELDTTEAT